MNKDFRRRGRNALHLLLGCLVTAAGLLILKHSHVVTGGTAGLSLSLSYLFHMQFHLMFLLLNVPFLVFAYKKMGRTFTLKTLAAISLLTAMTSIDNGLPAFAIPSLAGAIAGGAVVGAGVCALFKYGASLGGSTILALYLQKRYQLDPGKTNFAFDFLVVSISLCAVSLHQGLISVVSIAVTSVIISLYKNRLKGTQRAGIPSAARMPAATTSPSV